MVSVQEIRATQWQIVVKALSQQEVPALKEKPRVLSQAFGPISSARQAGLFVEELDKQLLAYTNHRVGVRYTGFIQNEVHFEVIDREVAQVFLYNPNTCQFSAA